jgi:cysteine desulfurase
LFTDLNVNLTSSIGKDLPAYLDNMATTPLDPRVLDAMLPYLSNNFGNPHSKSHKYGWDTEVACENARSNIA